MENFSESIQKYAREAGKVLLDFFHKDYQIRFKNENTGDLVTEADLAAEKIIINGIISDFPDHKIISEEKGLTGNTEGEYVWYIDPLDGTGNFARGVPHFAVSIGLYRGTEPVAGAVYDTVHNEMFFAEHGKGAFLNGKKLEAGRKEDFHKVRIAASWLWEEKMPKEISVRFIDYYKKLVLADMSRFYWNGSAALTLAYLARGRWDGVIITQLNFWDFAAGLIIAVEAGAKITDDKGRELPPSFIYNKKNSSILVLANEKLHSKIIETLNA